MKPLVTSGFLLTLVACNFNPDAKSANDAAKTLTRQYAKQELQASVAGNDCLVLLVRAKTALDSATVESIHYGTGEYRGYEGGVEQFADDRKFRAVVYRDDVGGSWTYGSITRSEAQSMPLCR